MCFSHSSVDHAHDENLEVQTSIGLLALKMVEDGVTPRFRLSLAGKGNLDARGVSIETVRPDGAGHGFPMVTRTNFLESTDEIPEPHTFGARILLKTPAKEVSTVEFTEQELRTRHGRS